MATVAMQAEKHPAELAHDEAQAAHTKINQRVEFFAGQRVTLEQEIERLQAQYDSACREAAKGNGVDPAPIATELQTKKAKLYGTVLLHAEAVAESAPLAKRAIQAGLSFARQKQQDQLADLLKAELDAKFVATAAVAEGERLVRAQNAINYEIGLVRKRLESLEKELRAAD
jgi:hypothetical protein